MRVRVALVIGVCALAVSVLATPALLHAATCTGADPCKACSNCKYCKRCAKDGKTCGVCKRGADRPSESD